MITMATNAALLPQTRGCSDVKLEAGPQKTAAAALNVSFVLQSHLIHL